MTAWAFVQVGTFCSVVDKLGERSNAHQEMMSDLNAFILDSHLDQALATRLRTYFRHMQSSYEPSWQARGAHCSRLNGLVM